MLGAYGSGKTFQAALSLRVLSTPTVPNENGGDVSSSTIAEGSVDQRFSPKRAGLLLKQHYR